MLNELDLHITNRCTISCDYCCFNSNRLKLEELSTDELKSVMDQAKALGCRHVHFTGGEPLIRDDICQLISYADSNGFEVRLQTNGMLLDEKMAEKLICSGLKSIMISLDSVIPEIHDEIRGKGSWHAAIKAIQTASRLGLKTRVNSVLTKLNMGTVVDTALFLHNMGIRDYSAFYFSPIGAGRHINNNAWIPPKDYYAVWNDIQDRFSQYNALKDMNIIIEKGYASWSEAKNINVKGFTGCGGGCVNTYNNRDYVIVRCDGNVYPCIMAIEETPLGNVRQQSLSYIINNSNVWKMLLPSVSDKCQGCEHYELCGGGCRFYPNKSNNNSNDFRCVYHELVPLCPIMKYNSKNSLLGGSSDDVSTE